MKMISESKLKEIRRSLYDDDGYTRINNPHFDLIFEEAFKAGMNYVNNGVLDDVSNSNEQKPIKYQCLFCNRSFKRRIPHNCKGGFRKRKIEWLPIYE